MSELPIFQLPFDIAIELLVFDPERRASFDDRRSPLHLRLHDLRRVCAPQSVTGEGMTSDEFNASVNEFMSNMTDIEMSEVIHRLQASPEERGLKRFTRGFLMQLSTRSPWDGAFDAQLDAHHEFQAPDHQHYMALKNVCRSVTGWVFTFASGRSVAYKSKLQTTVATSSAVHAAKTAKDLHSVLSDLGFRQDDGPTLLCADNQAATPTINENKPTPRKILNSPENDKQKLLT
jgi:hypothetical protein